jgi:hypothetical protein
VTKPELCSELGPRNAGLCGRQVGDVTEHPDQAPTPGGEDDLVDALRRLALLRDSDVLSEEEYQKAKAKVVDDHSERGPPR